MPFDIMNLQLSQHLAGEGMVQCTAALVQPHISALSQYSAKTAAKAPALALS